MTLKDNVVSTGLGLGAILVPALVINHATGSPRSQRKAGNTDTDSTPCLLCVKSQWR